MSHPENMTLDLTPAMLKIIKRDFDEKVQEAVITELFSIHLNHVMAHSEYNLNQTRHAILSLANGDLKDVIEFTKAAKIDFRDVIMWAGENQKK